nr:protein DETOXIFICATION 16-like [Ipomoea batatas]
MSMNPELCEDLVESPLTENGGFTCLRRLSKKWGWGDLSETTEELKKQLQLAGPLVLVSFLKYSLQMISLMFIGHLGDLPLSAASLATSFAQVTGFSFVDGMGGALETFCGQAYGAKQHRMLGIHMQRAVIVLMILGIPFSLVWAFAGEIFVFCKQDSEISANAGTYAKWLIPSIFPYGIMQCQVTFLQTQSILKPLAITTGFTSLIHGFLCWLLVFKFGLGNKGAALCNSISYWIIVLILGLYIKFSPSCKMTWTGISKEGGKNLFSFLSLGIPSAAMLCVVKWAYECLVLVAGLLPDPKLETSMMSISLCTSSVVFMIPYGLACAVSTRVSNELGAGRAKGAEVAARIGVYVAAVEGLVQCMICILARNVWGYLFSSDVVVVTYLASVMPVLAFSNFIDGFQVVLSGKEGKEQDCAAAAAAVCGAAVLVAALLVLAVRTTIVTWITVIVLLAFAGKRRRVLAKDGDKITSDVALCLAKVVLRGRGGVLAFSCAVAVLGFSTLAWIS